MTTPMTSYPLTSYPYTIDELTTLDIDRAVARGDLAALERWCRSALVQREEARKALAWWEDSQQELDELREERDDMEAARNDAYAELASVRSELARQETP